MLSICDVNNVTKLKSEIFELKKLMEKKDEYHGNKLLKNLSIICVSNTHMVHKYTTNLYNIFEYACDDYKSCNRNEIFTKLEVGESTKLLYTFTIDETKYLFMDFTHSVETAQDFVNISHYFDASEIIPHVFHMKNSYVITEYVEGHTLEYLVENTVKHGLIENILNQCVTTICDFKCRFESFSTFKILSTFKMAHNVGKEKVLSLMHVLDCAQYAKLGEQLVDMLYNLEKICMCHNDFMPANIMCDSSGKVKLIDYQDCGYNIEHYDLVSLLYSPKMYLDDKTRKNIIMKYYELITIKPSYELFILSVRRTAFVRLCKSLDLRVKKLINGKITSRLIIELRRGVQMLKQLEPCVKIYLSDALSKLLPPDNTCSVTLCAGFGKRMGGVLPKCANTILGKPMIEYVSNVLESYAITHNVYVVGYRKDIMIKLLDECATNPIYADQVEQLGTGHAVIQAIPFLSDNKTCFVIMGDMPIITYEMLQTIHSHHLLSNAVTTVVSANLKQKNSNGKIIRDSEGNFLEILECKDVLLMPNSEELLSISEVNTGLYVFESTQLKEYLLKLDNDNAQNEYYLTDVIKLQRNDGMIVNCVCINNICEPTGANTSDELKEIETMFSV
jgi:UTP-glucose-1-phosphate uridylyltransferase